MVVDYYDENQIKDNMEAANPWVQIESVIKLPVTSRMLKVKMKNIDMVKKAVEYHTSHIHT